MVGLNEPVYSTKINPWRCLLVQILKILLGLLLIRVSRISHSPENDFLYTLQKVEN